MTQLGDFSAIPDGLLRDAAVLVEKQMLETEDLDQRVILGDALELALDEIHNRIGEVDYAAIEALYSKPGRRSYTKALFHVHPGFGAK